MVIRYRYLPQALAVFDNDLALEHLRCLVVNRQREGFGFGLAVQLSRHGISVLSFRQSLCRREFRLSITVKAGVRHWRMVRLLRAAVIGFALIGQLFLVDLSVALICDRERQLIRIAQHCHRCRHMIVRCFIGHGDVVLVKTVVFRGVQVMAEIITAAVCAEQAEHGLIDRRCFIRVINRRIEDRRGRPVTVEAHKRQAERNRVAAIDRRQSYKTVDVNAVREIRIQCSFALGCQRERNIYRSHAVCIQRYRCRCRHGHFVCRQLTRTLGNIGFAVLLYRILGQYGHADFIFDRLCPQVMRLERERKAAARAVTQFCFRQTVIRRGQICFRRSRTAKLHQSGTLLAR